MFLLFCLLLLCLLLLFCLLLLSLTLFLCLLLLCLLLHFCLLLLCLFLLCLLLLLCLLFFLSPPPLPPPPCLPPSPLLSPTSSSYSLLFLFLLLLPLFTKLGAIFNLCLYGIYEEHTVGCCVASYLASLLGWTVHLSLLPFVFPEGKLEKKLGHLYAKYSHPGKEILFTKSELITEEKRKIIIGQTEEPHS